MMIDESNFPGLPSTWDISSTEDTYETISFINKIPTSKYLSTGKLAVIDQSANFIGGYIDDSELAVTKDLPVIVFGDHTRVIKFIDFPFAAGADGIKVIKPKEFFNPKLYYYFLKTIKLPNKGYARHFQYLRSSKIPIPPLNEQKRIADKLDRLLARVDACRDHLERVPGILKRFRQAVLSAAVSGKLTEEWRNQNSINYLWEQKTIGDVTENVKQHKPESHEEFYYIDIASIDKDKKKIVNPKKYDGKNAPSRARQVVETGDILVSMTRPNLNSVALVTIEFNYQIASTGFDVLRPKNIDPDWLFLLVCTDKFVTKMTELVQGALYPAIRPRDIRSFSIPTPSLKEQKEIVRRVEALFAFANRLESRYQATRKQVDDLPPALLAKAFRGELVPQNPNDEPASMLLERIRAEREATPKETEHRRKSVKMEAGSKVEGVMRKLTDIKPTHLSDILKENGQMLAERLWAASELEIDEFYEQLTDEESRGLLRELRVTFNDMVSVLEATRNEN